MSYCPKCGVNLPDTAKFCGVCGAQIAAKAAAPARQDQPARQTQQAQQTQQTQQAQQTDSYSARQQQAAYGTQYQQTGSYGTQYQQTGSYGTQYQQTGSYGTQYQQTGSYDPQYQQTGSYGTQYQQTGSYGAQYRQTGSYGAQYQQPQQQPYGYNAYPQQPGYAGNTGRQKPVKQKKGPGSPVFLRILSLLFAIGLIAAAAGLGSRLYFNRTYDAIHNEIIATARKGAGSNESDLKQISQLDSMIFGKNEAEIKALMTAAVSGDAKEVKKAAKDLIVHILKSSDQFSAIYQENRDEISKALNEFEDALDNKLVKEYLSEGARFAGEKFGFRWFILKISTFSSLLMIIGGALAGLSLILWIILRGPSAGMVKSGFLPMLCVALVLSAAIIILCLFVFAPIGYDDISAAAQTYQGPAWSAKKAEEILSLEAEVSGKMDSVANKYTNLLQGIAFSFMTMFGLGNGIFN